MTTATIDAPAAAGSAETTTLRFPVGLPGFAEARTFRVERWGGDDSPFLTLTCTEGASATFVIMRPQVFFPDYRPEVADAVMALIGLDDPSEVSLWVILTLGKRAEEATANLLAPLVVNAEAGLAVQAVQSGRRWHPRTPLTTAAVTGAAPGDR